jgi:molybdenum cofactor synthesis domain-containing protein
MRIKKIRVEDAVGKVLSHDITKIVPGQFKGVAFKKGYRLTDQDIPEMLKLGKEQAYVLDLEADDVHEDEAGIRLGQAAVGENVTITEPKESRVNLLATESGLLKVNIPALEAINELPQVIMATLSNNTPVAAGEMLAGTKVIPLAVKESLISKAEEICRLQGKIVSVKLYRSHSVGIIVTGGEIYSGLIQDKFGPVLKAKVDSFGSRVVSLKHVPDDPNRIATLITEMIENKVQLVLVSGGMSVDPDDVTPQGITMSGANVEIYGAPVLPGAMFLLAYSGSVPVIGIPACGIYYRTTILDLVLPRLLTGEHLLKKDIVVLAHGGLCRICRDCNYPNCSFGLARVGTM